MRSFNFIATCVCAAIAFYSCSKPDDVQKQPGGDSEVPKPVVDKRLTDCTIAEIEFKGQKTTPEIKINGNTATIDFKIDPTGLDLSAVEITKLAFRYNDQAYAPTASVGVGDALNLKNQTADIVVTSKNGEKTCTYTVSATSDIIFNVENPFQGTVTFDLIGGIPWGAGSSFLVFIGGNGDPAKPDECDVRMTTDAELGDGIHSHVTDPDNKEKDCRAMTLAEQDNIISFKYTSVDPSDGTTYGTYVNDAGPDGKYSDFIYYAFDQPSRKGEDAFIDLTEIYRLLPKGKMRWSQAYQSNAIRFYNWEDSEYTTIVSEVTLMDKNDKFVYPFVNYSLAQWMSPEEVSAGKHITIPVSHYAFHKEYTWDEQWAQKYSDKFNHEEEWSDTRYGVSNIRDIFWLVDIAAEPVQNHDELLK